MEFKKFLPSFLIKEEKIEKLRKKIREAREELTNLMVEVFELRAKVREVLEAVTERVGKLGKKKELLINKVSFLRKRLASSVMDMREEDEKIWRQTEEKIHREYSEVFEKIKKNREFRDNENPKKKKSRLKKVWMELAKIFHPDKHMDKEKDREAYEEMMVAVNQAKKEGNLEALEAIARNPEKFLREAEKKVKSPESKTLDHNGNNSKKSAQDEEKELLMTLNILLEDIKKIRSEEKKLKKSADLTLWKMWKNRPEEFENTIREMETKLLSEMETLEKVLSKLMKKLDKKIKSGWNI